MWKKNIRRIIMNKNKELSIFREIKHCQRDMKLRLVGTPACYQAWKDINALSKVQSSVFIRKNVSTCVVIFTVCLLKCLIENI